MRVDDILQRSKKLLLQLKVTMSESTKYGDEVDIIVNEQFSSGLFI